MQKFIAILGFSLALTPMASAQPQEKNIGKLQTVARFYGAMPTGVTVSKSKRIFVNFPRWGDNVPFTVAEIKNGRAVPFPNLEFNSFAANGTRKVVSMEKSMRAQNERLKHLVSVQSVVIDPDDNLWILDTGSIMFGPTAFGGPKMVKFNLQSNQIERVITFPASVALPKTYMNDVRFDLRKNVAYITDSGAGGIIVVNLKNGRSFRRLDKHFSVKNEPKFVAFVEGRPVFSTPPKQFPRYLALKSDGIALSADGTRLYYCPLASRRLYSVSTDALVNPNTNEDVVESTVIDHGDKGMADGLESDAQNRVYVTSVEQNAITRRLPNGLFETLVRSPKLLWPDTLSLAQDGSLYVIANQLHRQKSFNYGKDLRVKPYSLFKIQTDGTPIALR